MPAPIRTSVWDACWEQYQRRHQAHPSPKTHAHIVDAGRVNAIRSFYIKATMNIDSFHSVPRDTGNVDRFIFIDKEE